MKTFITILMLSAWAFGYAQERKAVYKDTDFVRGTLERQNAYRSDLGLPPLTWSPALAEDALAWAQELARLDKGQHDPQIRTKNEGENIWWGTAGAFSFGQMVDFWGSEKKDFTNGVFPDCRTKRSAVVGHYTQIIWKKTSATGCALVSNGKTDFLVCRYSPPGNVQGEMPY